MYNLWYPAMSKIQMIRKQLYITREQDRALKKRARQEGASEAEVVREALDNHLRPEAGPVLPAHQCKVLEGLLAANEKIAAHHRFPKGYRFNREELYADREDRWFNKT